MRLVAGFYPTESFINYNLTTLMQTGFMRNHGTVVHPVVGTHVAQRPNAPSTAHGPSVSSPSAA